MIGGGRDHHLVVGVSPKKGHKKTGNPWTAMDDNDETCESFFLHDDFEIIQLKDTIIRDVLGSSMESYSWESFVRLDRTFAKNSEIW